MSEVLAMKPFRPVPPQPVPGDHVPSPPATDVVDHDQPWDPPPPPDGYWTQLPPQHVRRSRSPVVKVALTVTLVVGVIAAGAVVLFLIYAYVLLQGL